MFEIKGNQIFISQIYRPVGPMGGKLDFFIPLGFEAKTYLDHRSLLL